MITWEMTMIVQIMYKQGVSKKRIARELGISINTVRKYLKASQKPTYSQRAPQPMKLDPYRDYLRQRIQQAHPRWIPATVLYREIQAQGYLGKIGMVRHFLRQQKPAITEEPLVRFETAPGYQMQVDWACFRKGADRLSAFIATLGYSRMSYVEFVEDETLSTLLRCHEQSFDYFGGIPHEIVYDNMKTVMIQRDCYGVGQHRLQAGFWDFSKHHGFKPRVCRPYRPQTKGKVERFIRYLKHSFYYPLEAQFMAMQQGLDCATANQAVLTWLNEVANHRHHRTLQCSPQARFEEDQVGLQPLVCAYQGTVPNATTTTVSTDYLTMPTLQHDLTLYDQLK